MKITLTSKGFGQINPNFLSHDFVFLIGLQEYPCNKIQADFLSPKVANMHQVDPFINCFLIGSDNNSLKGDFSAFMDYMKTGEICIHPKQFRFYYQVSKILGNSELSNELMRIITEEHRNKEQLSSDEIIRHLIILDQFEDYNNDFIDFVASHFHELSMKLIEAQLSFLMIQAIISNQSLSLENESQLLSFILAFQNVFSYEETLLLFDLMDYSCLDMTDFQNMKNYIDSHRTSNDCFIMEHIWNLVINSAPQNQVKSNTRNIQSLFANKIESNNTHLFSFDGSNGLKGIINYLNTTSQGNAAKNGTIELQCSSTNNSFLNITNLCDFSNLSRISMWSPEDKPASYFEYDFKDKRIRLTEYTFATPVDPSMHYPRSWTVECSNDRKKWDIVDTRINEASLKKHNKCHTFRCKSPSLIDYQYVRIVSRGPSWGNIIRNAPNHYFFDLAAVEFFGCLIINP